MVGIDIVKIDRFDSINNLESFLNKYFVLTEIDYIKQKKYSTQTIAGLYACKEAVLKAFGVGIGSGLSLNEVEITHDKLGAPQIVLTENIKVYLQKFDKKTISVSISHDGEYAISVCQIL